MALIINANAPEGKGCDGCEYQETRCEQMDTCSCCYIQDSVHDFHNTRHPKCPILGKMPDKYKDLVEKIELSKGLLLENSKGEKFFAIKVEDYNNIPIIVKGNDHDSFKRI